MTSPASSALRTENADAPALSADGPVDRHYIRWLSWWHRGVAQPGQSACFGSKRPAVRICPPRPGFVSRKNLAEGSFCSVKDINAKVPKWVVRDSRNITARHSNGCNLSFADGHCEHWKYKDPRTVKLADWQMSPEDASNDNPDLEHTITLLKGR